MKRIYTKREKISITKYNPIYRNDLGHFMRDEWTAICDIGKVYNGVLFEMEEYNRIEDLYVNAVLLALCFFKSKSVKVTYLYTPFKNKDLKKTSPNLYDVFINASADSVIKDLYVIDALIRLRLRENIAGLELLIDTKSRTEILFGFDYYMYIKTNKDISVLKNKIEETGLFIY